MTSDLGDLTEQDTKNVAFDQMTEALERLLKDTDPEQRIKVLRVLDMWQNPYILDLEEVLKQGLDLENTKKSP